MKNLRHAYHTHFSLRRSTSSQGGIVWYRYSTCTAIHASLLTGRSTDLSYSEKRVLKQVTRSMYRPALLETTRLGGGTTTAVGHRFQWTSTIRNPAGQQDGRGFLTSQASARQHWSTKLPSRSTRAALERLDFRPAHHTSEKDNNEYTSATVALLYVTHITERFSLT